MKKLLLSAALVSFFAISGNAQTDNAPQAPKSDSKAVSPDGTRKAAEPAKAEPAKAAATKEAKPASTPGSAPASAPASTAGEAKSKDAAKPAEPKKADKH